jgi:hypothetical protein
MGVLGVCMALAAALPGAVPTFVPTQSFTLAWMHSIEHVRWEEDYAVRPGPQGSVVLVALQSRIKGSAAGMEPPDDARWVNGWYAYTPREREPQALPLSRSPYTADFDWCMGGTCRPLSALLPSDGGETLVWPCRDGQPRLPPARFMPPQASGSSG